MKFKKFKLYSLLFLNCAKLLSMEKPILVQTAQFFQLPKESKLIIFSFVGAQGSEKDINDLKRSMLVCKEFNRLCTDDDFTKKYLEIMSRHINPDAIQCNIAQYEEFFEDIGFKATLIKKFDGYDEFMRHEQQCIFLETDLKLKIQSACRLNTAISRAIIFELLQKYPKARYDTFLLACYEGSSLIVQHLLAEKIHPNIETIDGYTDLMLAAKKDRSAVIAKLIACKDLNINQKQFLSGFTAFAFAAKNGHISCVNELLKHPDILTSESTNDCKTPYMLAHENGFIEITKLIHNHRPKQEQTLRRMLKKEYESWPEYYKSGKNK